MLKQKEYTGTYGKKTAYSIYHVNDLISDYNRTSSGHFFDKDTMRFFNSRVIEYFRGNGETAYFITSEKFDSNSKRLFTVREVKRVKVKSFHGYKYSIDTVEEFQAFKTSAAAKKYIEKLLKREVQS